RVIQDFAQEWQPAAVHEHDAIHELSAVFATGFEHVVKVLTADGARFFAENVFSCLGRADHPFFADPSRQRDVNGIDVVAFEQLAVTAAGERGRLEGNRGLAFLNELLRAGTIATGNRDQRRIAGQVNGLPNLAGNVRRTENSPAARLL